MPIQAGRYAELTGEHWVPPFTNSILPMITLVVNSDGVEHVKSSPQSLTPVLLCVNELPPKLRSEMIITTMLFVKTKTMKFDDRLLWRLVADLNKLGTDGVRTKYVNN